VLAAAAFAATRLQVARNHMLPNALGPLIVAVTLACHRIFTERA